MKHGLCPLSRLLAPFLEPLEAISPSKDVPRVRFSGSCFVVGLEKRLGDSEPWSMGGKVCHCGCSCHQGDESLGGRPAPSKQSQLPSPVLQAASPLLPGFPLSWLSLSRLRSFLVTKHHMSSLRNSWSFPPHVS